MVLAILVSSFIAVEISRSQSPRSNQTVLVPSASSPTPTPNKIIILPPAPASPKPAKPATAPRAAQPGPAAGWRLVWADEFTGPAGGAPDASKWGRDTGGGGWGNSELEYYTDTTANAALDGHGDLAITARTDGTDGLSCWYGGCRYTSARLLTLGHFAPAYGRISARIKLPAGQGLWPSFWALGDNFSVVGWPRAGQLNIMSNLGSDPATVSAGLIGPGYTAWAGATLAGGSFAAGFHTFSADWYPDHITFAADGHPYATQYRAKAGAGWVFDHPFFLVLNLAVGGTQPGAPGAATTFPQQMLVDWVRVYQTGPPTTPATGPITTPTGQCAQVTTGGTVQLGRCAGGGAQTWTLGTGGTISTQGGCLTALANATAPRLTACTHASAQTWQAQTWQAQTNG